MRTYHYIADIFQRLRQSYRDCRRRLSAQYKIQPVHIVPPPKDPSRIEISYDPVNELIYHVKKGYGGAIYIGGGNDDDIADYTEQYSKESVDNKRFYNIGSGAFYHPVWTNIDIKSECYGGRIDIEYDLEKLGVLPIETNSAEIVYTAHTLEHLSPRASENCLREAFRILKPGGIIRIVLPDSDYYWANYKARTRNFPIYGYVKFGKLPFRVVHEDEISPEQAFIFEIASSACALLAEPFANPISTKDFIEAQSMMSYEKFLEWCVSHVDETAHVKKKLLGFHRNWWNRVKLRRKLIEAGFMPDKIWDSTFGQSRAKVLRNVRYFDLGSYYQDFSLYVEAIK